MLDTNLLPVSQVYSQPPATWSDAASWWQPFGEDAALRLLMLKVMLFCLLPL